MDKTKLLTEQPTSLGLDAMLEALPHLQAIMADPQLHALGEKAKGDKARTIGDLSQEAVPLIVGNHRRELVAVAAAVTGRTPEEVAAQPLGDTLAAFQGALGGEVLAFFVFCGRLALSC